MPGFSMTRVPLVPPSTAPLLTTTGATAGSAPALHCLAPGPAPGPTPGPTPAGPAILNKASESTTPSVQTTGAEAAEPCAETRQSLRRRATELRDTKSSLAARPIGRRKPRVTSSRWKASLPSTAKDFWQQTKREDAQEKNQDEMFGTPKARGVRSRRHSAYTRRVERKAFRKGALRTSCVSALREKEVSQGRGRERGLGRKGL